MSGFTVEAIVSVDGTAGSFSRLWCAVVGYAGGPFSIGAGYLIVRDPNTSFFGANPNAGPATSNNLGGFGSASSPESNPVFAGYSSAQMVKITAVSLGAANVNLTFPNTRWGSNSGPNTLGYWGTATFNNVEINAKYRFTSSLLMGVAYDYMRNGGAGRKGGTKYNLLSAGADYLLSKCIDLYTVAVYEKVSGVDSARLPWRR